MKIKNNKNNRVVLENIFSNPHEKVSNDMKYSELKEDKHYCGRYKKECIGSLCSANQNHKKCIYSDKIVESISGFSCPNCNTTYSETSMINSSDSVFEQFPDPHYKWLEIYCCNNCKTIYSINNAT